MGLGFHKKRRKKTCLRHNCDSCKLIEITLSEDDKFMMAATIRPMPGNVMPFAADIFLLFILQHNRCNDCVNKEPAQFAAINQTEI